MHVRHDDQEDRMRRSVIIAAMAGTSAAFMVLAGSTPLTMDSTRYAAGSDTVRVHVEAGSAGFAPDTVRLVAGRPANIVFTRTAASSCMAEVHIPDLGVARTALPQGQPVIIRVEPAQPGAYEFRCGMNMRRGTIIVSGKP
jgi:plastocyanin domain-containing protein